MTNFKDQWIQVVEQYLIAAKWCVDTSSHGGGILGYSAALLLLCTTDAIGHGLLAPIEGKHTRLDVLMQPPFDPALNLDASKIKNLEGRYRHMLAHTGTMSPDVFLDHPQGRPFDFDQGGNLRLIRVPAFYEVVEAAWEKRDRSVFNPPSMGRKPPDLSAQPSGFSSLLSPAFSGVASRPGS